MLLLGALFGLAFGNGNPTYRLYNGNGKSIRYQKMIRQLKNADIVFFGELHNDPIAHWLELQIARDLHKQKGDRLVLGAEMFEADNQKGLQAYLKGELSEEEMTQRVRLWKNYYTDYRALVELAKTEGLPFVATNIPRRYASMVFRGGLDVLERLDKEEKRWMAPLPIAFDPNVNCYKKMLEMGNGHKGKNNLNFPKAQAIKDATMAYFILQNWEKGKLFLHFNGSYHSNNFEGIIWYLKRARPDLKILTIATERRRDIRKLEESLKGISSFLLMVPEDMTRTY